MSEAVEPTAAEDDTPYEPGDVLWHCSEEGGGPDVGIQIGLGLGMSLYCGEMSTATLQDHGIDLDTYPDGWWLVLYGPEDTWIIGAVPENYRAQDAVEHIGWALAEAAKSAPPAESSLSGRQGSEANTSAGNPATDATTLCSDCPPVGYPTEETRCAPCPRRSPPPPHPIGNGEAGSEP